MLLSTPPRLLLWLWPLLDRMISRCLRIEPLRKDKTGIINIEHRRHRGLPVRLDDGTTVNPGDPLLELHLNNAWFRHHRRNLADADGEVRWRTTSAFAEDLRYLARQMQEGGPNTEITALHGRTTLSPQAKRLGFTVVALPHRLRQRLTMFYLNGLRRIYYFGKGKGYAKHRKPPILNEVWMSKSRLLERYC